MWQLTVATYSARRPARPLPVCAERLAGPLGPDWGSEACPARPLANGSQPDPSCRVRHHPVVQPGDWDSILFAVSALATFGVVRINRNSDETFGPLVIPVFAAVGLLRLSRFPSANVPAGYPLRWRYGMGSIFVLSENRFSITVPISPCSTRAMPSLFSSSPRPYSFSPFSSWRQAQDVILAGIY